MNNYRNINDTRYVISRVFSESGTTAMIIKQRVKNNVRSFERNDGALYNKNGGSIRSKEGL